MRKRTSRLFERRQAQRERTEILIAYDSAGNEDWEDLQDYLDRVLVMPMGDEYLTLADFKRRQATLLHARPPA